VLPLILSGDRCRLRPYRADDASAVFAVADDFMVARWMTRAFPHPYTRPDAERWIAKALSDGLGRHFVIEVDGALAGGVGFDPFEAERCGTASFGYWLGRAYWGLGIATEAARMLSDHAFRDCGLRRLEARVFAENRASARVLEKTGFVLEGVLRESYLDRNDIVCDALMYGRLRSHNRAAASP
jgi:[ribosomal protein S5]-alanine N-acetyltransferase